MNTSVHRAVPVMAILALSLLRLQAQTVVFQPSRAERTTETRTVPLKAGSELVVKASGNVRVEPWDQETVAVTGAFEPSSRKEQVSVILASSPGRLEIRGEQPKVTVRFGTYLGPICHLSLKVPRRLNVRIENGQGSIDVAGVQGNLHCETATGAITAREVEGAFTARTAFGAVSVEGARGSLDVQAHDGSFRGTRLGGISRGLKIATDAGHIHLDLSGIRGRLLARTEDGAIEFTGSGAKDIQRSERDLSATFPGGDQAIHLSTRQGRITVR